MEQPPACIEDFSAADTIARHRFVPAIDRNVYEAHHNRSKYAVACTSLGVGTKPRDLSASTTDGKARLIMRPRALPKRRPAARKNSTAQPKRRGEDVAQRR